MELEEMKNRWSQLEEQLKKQKIMNEKLICEVRQSRSGPLSQLVNYTALGIGLLVLLIPFLIYVYTQSYFGTLKTALFLFAGLIIAVHITIGIRNIRHLKKIDFTKNVSANIRLVQTYKINIKRQSIATYIIMSIFIILALVAVAISSSPPETWRLIGIGIVIVAGIVLSYFEYKKIYKAKTNAILHSLDELKELE